MVIRRYLAWGAAALAAGLMLFLRWGGTALCVLLLCCLALGLIRPLRPLWRPLLCGLMAAALVGGVYALRLDAARQLTGSTLPFSGTVLSVSPYTAHRSTVYARVAGQHRVLHLTATLPEEDTPLAGEPIAGTLTVTGAESDGKALLLSGGVALTARQTAASAAGVSHLLAVSGLHLSILLGACAHLGDALLWSRRRRAVLSALCCLTMMTLAGFSTSVLRAAWMAALSLGAPLRGRRGDGLTGLGFAVIVLLLLDPAAVWDLGFLLSCGATLGILLLARPLTRLWPAARRSRPGRLLWETACVSLAAQLGTLPVAALSFGYLPAYGILSNLLILPLVYGVMLFAFLTLFCLPLGVAAYPFAAARFFAAGIAAVARGVARLPGAVLPCTAPWQWPVPAVFTVLLLAAVLLRSRRARLRLMLLGCAAGVVLLGVVLPLQHPLSLTADAATGSVLVQQGDEALLLTGVRDGYGIHSLNRFLQRCGSPAVTVLAQPPQQSDLSAGLRLAAQTEPSLFLWDAESARLGEGQLPPTVTVLPYCDTIRNILSDYTLYELENIGTVLQIGPQKVLKCWTGYGIITAEDIPADCTAVIDREGRLWTAPGCDLPVYRGGDMTILLPKEEAAP